MTQRRAFLVEKSQVRTLINPHLNVAHRFEKEIKAHVGKHHHHHKPFFYIRGRKIHNHRPKAKFFRTIISAVLIVSVYYLAKGAL